MLHSTELYVCDRIEDGRLLAPADKDSGPNNVSWHWRAPGGLVKNKSPWLNSGAFPESTLMLPNLSAQLLYLVLGSMEVVQVVLGVVPFTQIEGPLASLPPVSDIPVEPPRGRTGLWFACCSDVVCFCCLKIFRATSVDPNLSKIDEPIFLGWRKNT